MAALKRRSNSSMSKTTIGSGTGLGDVSSSLEEAPSPLPSSKVGEGEGLGEGLNTTTGGLLVSEATSVVSGAGTGFVADGGMVAVVVVAYT